MPENERIITSAEKTEWKAYVIPDLMSWGNPQMKTTPIEKFDNFEDAFKRFEELRGEAYNFEPAVNPNDGSPYARLSFGIESKKGFSSMDVIHVRNGKNYICDDFTRQNPTYQDESFQNMIDNIVDRLGAERIRFFEIGEDGRYLPPVDLDFSEWKREQMQNSENPVISVSYHPHRYDEFILKEIASGGTLMTGTREEVRRFCEAELAASVDLPVLDKLIDNAETARQNHIAEMKEKEISQETEFLEHDGCYAAIYQIRNLPENRDISFMDLDYLEKNGLEPDRERYSFVYSFEVLPEDLKDKDEFLNKVYAKFNLDHPKDFTGHSLSVSDVIAINNHGEITSHFVDSFDFTEIKGFVKERENPLKAVEDAVEQNDNSFDGVINNIPSDSEKEAAEEKTSEKKSIMSFLKETKPVTEKSNHEENSHSIAKGIEI